MMSLPATKNLAEFDEIFEQKSPKRSKAAGQRVVNLFDGRTRRKKGELSRAERERLILEFRLKARKLARSILRRWHARLDLQEVDSVVDLSLCEAVRRYDPTKGAAFMTFLFYHLRGNLIRAVSAAASANLVPTGDAEADTERTKRSQHKGINAIEVAEALCNHDYMLPDEILFKKELMGLSAAACSKLDALEREVIHRIYIKEQQLMDIAHSLGYSRCHISRVKKKALETLHEHMSVSMQAEEEAEAAVELATSERRKIHRRRPRSKKSRQAREALKQAISAAA